MGYFKPGDLVRIRNGTHQEGIPSHRIGLIVRECEPNKSYTSFYEVAFAGTGATLKFHEMFLELKNESR